jgi:hypothetical protein
MRIFTTVLLCALGAFTGGTLAQQLAADMKLEDAGFVMRPAHTAKELEHIKKLPARRFVARTKNGQRYYLYADPDLCKCVFLGNAIAFEAYRDMRKRLQQPDAVPGSGVNTTDVLATEMDGDVSNLIDDGNILDWKF